MEDKELVKKYQKRILTRQSHRDANGQKVGIDEDFQVGDADMFLPNDPDAPLNETANCRCSVRYVKDRVLSSEEDIRRRTDRQVVLQTEAQILQERLDIFLARARQNLGSPIRAYGRNSDTIILYSKKIEEVRSGGTLSWRNNNPGNLRNFKFSISHRSLGDAGGFAVFARVEDGMNALIALLNTSTYQSLSLFSAINRYAPTTENNTSNYQKFIERITGIRGNTPLKSLSTGQLRIVALAIRRIEGWRVGMVTWRIVEK